ncbi:Nuclear receptor-interacting protein 3 [Branchiostoma belcheri]|nr:Nuclear receptor-interacting protein 3 [Branchiostoma belcheri]
MGCSPLWVTTSITPTDRRRGRVRSAPHDVRIPLAGGKWEERRRVTSHRQQPQRDSSVDLSTQLLLGQTLRGSQRPCKQGRLPQEIRGVIPSITLEPEAEMSFKYDREDIREAALKRQQKRLGHHGHGGFVHRDSSDLLPIDDLKKMGTVSKETVGGVFYSVKEVRTSGRSVVIG